MRKTITTMQQKHQCDESNNTHMIKGVGAHEKNDNTNATRASTQKEQQLKKSNNNNVRRTITTM
jgi:hypothetical protein